MKVIIISGERGEGKTTFLKKCIDELHNRQRPVFGFYAANTQTSLGNEGYRIYKVNSNESLLLCERNNPQTGNISLADFWFNEKAVEAGEKWITEGIATENPVFVLDEAGKFEIDGYIWDSVIKKLLQLKSGTLLLTVRNRFVKRIMEKYHLNSTNCEIVNNLLFTVEFVDKIE